MPSPAPPHVFSILTMSFQFRAPLKIAGDPRLIDRCSLLRSIVELVLPNGLCDRGEDAVSAIDWIISADRIWIEEFGKWSEALGEPSPSSFPRPPNPHIHCHRFFRTQDLRSLQGLVRRKHIPFIRSPQ